MHQYIQNEYLAPHIQITDWIRELKSCLLYHWESAKAIQQGIHEDSDRKRSSNSETENYDFYVQVILMQLVLVTVVMNLYCFFLMEGNSH